MNLCLMFCESKDDGCGEQVSLMTETSSLTATHVNLAFHSLKQCWSLACPAMTSTCKYFRFATQMTDVSIINFKKEYSKSDCCRGDLECLLDTDNSKRQAAFNHLSLSER
ncbi:hypothetical protein T4C_4236 [Trichinella pseudospiralis]|uniref:Uncharacterized protein n=1 Tax=Trichinella pseudospiralis TaxID=6337 RepID=A0A0V1JSD9_TRIPS|nr:hypothetical protein T4C_4236 [Trichinella pseudospiralis]